MLNTDSAPATQNRMLVYATRAALIFSLFGYVMLSLAEQGDVGSALEPIPPSPLPFERTGVFGLDLSQLSSVEALEWMREVEQGTIPLIVVPVDGDIVAAMADESRASVGRTAIDSLLQATSETPLAICFRRPISSQDQQTLAETAIQYVQDNYSDRVAYISACGEDDEQEWRQALVDVLEVTGDPSPNELLPLSVAASVSLEVLSGRAELERSHLRAFSGSTYVLPVLNARQPVDDRTRAVAQAALTDAAQIGLVLVRPAPEVDRRALIQSIAESDLNLQLLPEGFTSVTSPMVRFGDAWDTSTIGTVAYQHTDQTASAAAVEFIGTSLYVVGLRSPERGQVSIWVDRPASPGQSSPDNVIDLSSEQSQYDAVELIQGLPSGQHSLTLVTSGGEVSIAGFFVSGSPAAGWNSGLAGLGLIAIATGSLAFLSLRRVRLIRSATGPPASDPYARHPREFTRGG